MNELKYLTGYSDKIISQVWNLIKIDKLGIMLKKKYPQTHDIKSNKSLYEYTIKLKNNHLRKSQPLSKVVYDNKIDIIKHALGTNTYISRIQGNKLKSKNEIKISSIFKNVPLEFLKMIVVHELAHLKEKNHDKAFYKLCEKMDYTYHQTEFDLRLYLTYLELFGKLYQ